MTRELKYAQALREATEIAMTRDPAVYVMGLGVPDPKGIFGSTLGLKEKFGDARVMDMPCSENGMTGVAIGSALAGMRPLMTHQRIDFALLAVEQLVNQAAKWRYMFGGKMTLPLVVRMIVGRGWGQGPQHSQSLQSWFAHVPGLRVALPATPHDAKGLLLEALRGQDPAVFIEHRWLYGISGPVPEGDYTVPFGKARVVRPGRDLTIAATSYMVLEAVRAAETLAKEGIEAEVLDLRTLRPLDVPALHESVRRTGRLLAADTGWTLFGAAAEIVASAVDGCWSALKAAPARLGLPDCPTPTSPELAKRFYPRAAHVAAAARKLLGRPPGAIDDPPATSLDVPDPTFTGPF